MIQKPPTFPRPKGGESSYMMFRGVWELLRNSQTPQASFAREARLRRGALAQRAYLAPRSVPFGMRTPQGCPLGYRKGIL
jgi:hypothetical protein